MPPIRDRHARVSWPIRREVVRAGAWLKRRIDIVDYKKTATQMQIDWYRPKNSHGEGSR
jgi:hypothetical protein